MIYTIEKQLRSKTTQWHVENESFTCLLDDEEYFNSLSVNIPKWKSEEEKELSDRHWVCDWIKYNIRMHTIKYSQKKMQNREMTKKG